jgi:hypothetical protein
MSPPSSTLLLKQQQQSCVVDMCGGSPMKRTHQESNSSYQDESLQAKIKEADRQKLDQEN